MKMTIISWIISVIVMCPLATLWFIIILGTSLGYVVHFYPNMLLRNLFIHGKTSNELMSMSEKQKKRNPLIVALHWIQIPKSNFSHFYTFASVYTTVATGVLLISYYQQNVHERIIWYLDIIAGYSRKTSVTSVATIVAMLLFLLQVLRRMYETLYVSVYSSSSKMNLIHYALGFTFYFGVATSLLAEAPGFTREGFRHKSFKQPYGWKWYQVFGTAIYFWAAWHQSKCATILANLRKDKKGQVVNEQHGIAKGDWFDLLSNPHFFAEILIYISLNIVLEFQNGLMILALIWTLENQVLAGLMSHKWYLSTYSGYPEGRKAIIPFIL